MKKLIDYVIKFPEKDEFLLGYKYPFNSCEILCSDNGLNISKLIKMPLGRLLKEKNKENKKNDKEVGNKDLKEDIKEKKEDIKGEVNNEIKKIEDINNKIN